MKPERWLGVDTGGTFTDLVLVDADGVRVHKVLSTPGAPEVAILEGVEALGLAPAIARGEVRIVHGSTVATNAALERRGVRTAYVADAGLGDVLTLGRQARAALYDLTPASEPPPVPPELCLELDARLAADGSVQRPLTAEALEDLVARVRAARPEAVAVNLLYSWLDEQHERAVAEALAAALGPAVFVTRSSFVLPEYREYERGIATWLNAWLGPRVQGYLDRLRRALAPASVAVMQSAGGTMEAEVAATRAVNLLLSGPAGGVAGARYLGRLDGSERLLTFDMGGTSTDVALVDGEPALAADAHLGPWPVAVPMLDIHTIGAGGGSLATLDAGGALRVGPESAGADPGPACYGRGGRRATVTDAHVVLGRLPAAAALGGSVRLDVAAAREAVGALADALGTDLETAARGILRIADEHMARALRVMSVERGRDPRGFTLCCFGGAGGLHLCALAERLGMTRALVPAHAGLLSALGMLVAAPERNLSRTLRRPLAELDAATARTALGELAAAGRAELEREGHGGRGFATEYALDLRYRGQAHALQLELGTDAAGRGGAAPELPTVDPAALAERFHARHAERYGHALRAPVEVVTLRVRVRAVHTPPVLPTRAHGAPAEPAARVPVAGEDAPVELFERESMPAGQRLAGPALVVEATATTWIAPGWRAVVTERGALLLEREAAGARAPAPGVT
ncbi:MAG: hydantoinase/oxoprolinase family protein [Pseudomonadales bacterium]|nr:hydantoinase/oxoprolinase family protein [Pseudomonadales bacterium]